MVRVRYVVNIEGKYRERWDMGRRGQGGVKGRFDRYTNPFFSED